MVNDILLDAETWINREQIHEAFQKSFRFSSSYEYTLDALYDALIEVYNTRLTLCHAEMLLTNLGNYGELLLQVLTICAMENPMFILMTA